MTILAIVVPSACSLAAALIGLVNRTKIGKVHEELKNGDHPR